jgi:hypothetical protein
MMRPSRSWLLLCALHAVGSMLVWWAGESVFAPLVWRADHAWFEPWAWWTSAWVHLNTAHLIGNQIAMGMLAGLAWLVRPSRRSTWAWLLSWPLLQLSLLVWPQIGYAVGLTGLLHAGAAILGVDLLLRRIRIPKARRWGGLLLLALLIKLLLEQAWRQPVVWNAADDMAVVQALHLSGALWGVVLSFSLGLDGAHATYWPWSARQRSTSGAMSAK